VAKLEALLITCNFCSFLLYVFVPDLKGESTENPVGV